MAGLWGHCTEKNKNKNKRTKTKEQIKKQQQQQNEWSFKTSNPLVKILFARIFVLHPTNLYVRLAM